MYTVNKGPSKLVAKTRSGLNQTYQNSDTCGSVGVSGIYESDISGAKPIFQKFRRSHSNRNNYGNDSYYSCMNEINVNEPPSPQYEELIKYIRDSWDGLSNEGTVEYTTNQLSTSKSNGIDLNDNNNNKKSQHQHQHQQFKSTKINPNDKKKIVVYHNDPPSPALRDFGPFDLESWWGRRLFINITKSL